MLDVINITDGRRLGNVIDLDLDVETGAIKALLLPNGRGRLSLFRSSGPDVEVPWSRIVKIGVDVILVELPTTQLAHPSLERTVPLERTLKTGTSRS